MEISLDLLIVRVKATLLFPKVSQCLEQLYKALLQSTRRQHLLQTNLAVAEGARFQNLWREK